MCRWLNCPSILETHPQITQIFSGYLCNLWMVLIFAARVDDYACFAFELRGALVRPTTEYCYVEWLSAKFDVAVFSAVQREFC